MKKLITAFMFGTLVGLCSFTATAEETVNINTANAETLAAVLDGVGKVKAQAIVDYRKDNGDDKAFKTVDDITKVNGIGPKTLEKNRSKMRVSDAQTKDAPKEEPEKDDENTAETTEESATDNSQ